VRCGENAVRQLQFDWNDNHTLPQRICFGLYI
jgi:hypothetical protein